MKAVRVRVSGRVQGVSYRVWTRDEAERLGVRGWVRNERDGSVVALVAGPEDAVERMGEAMRRGPWGAVVAELAIEPVEAEEVPEGFEIRG
jgi:acylphosphatase